MQGGSGFRRELRREHRTSIQRAHRGEMKREQAGLYGATAGKCLLGNNNTIWSQRLHSPSITGAVTHVYIFRTKPFFFFFFLINEIAIVCICSVSTAGNINDGDHMADFSWSLRGMRWFSTIHLLTSCDSCNFHGTNYANNLTIWVCAQRLDVTLFKAFKSDMAEVAFSWASNHTIGSLSVEAKLGKEVLIFI